MWAKVYKLGTNKIIMKCDIIYIYICVYIPVQVIQYPNTCEGIITAG